MLEGRDWFGLDGAAISELAALKAVAPDGIPSIYLDLLAFSNGGEGPLPVSPYNFCLDAAATVVENIKNSNYSQPHLQGFLIFGSSGGGEYLAFDIRAPASWHDVTIDMVAGGDTAEVVAPDFDVFYDWIGLEAAAP